MFLRNSLMNSHMKKYNRKIVLNFISIAGLVTFGAAYPCVTLAEEGFPYFKLIESTADSVVDKVGAERFWTQSFPFLGREKN